MNIIAIDDKDVRNAGCIAWWRLSGGLDLGELQQAWEAVNLPLSLLPDRPSPAVAARRAVGELRTTRRLVRPLSKGGFVVVDEREQGDDLEYTTDLKVSVDKVGRLLIVPADHTAADQVRVAFQRYQNELVQADVSPWLCDLMEKTLDAVRLRDTGGVYFIPRHALETWRRIVSALRAGSKHALNSVPAMRTEDAVAAIEDAIADEALQAVAAIEAQLAEGELGKRALENRIAQTTVVEQKLARYEELLGGRMESLHAKLDALRANITVAITKTEVEDQAAQ